MNKQQNKSEQTEKYIQVLHYTRNHQNPTEKLLRRKTQQTVTFVNDLPSSTYTIYAQMTYVILNQTYT